LIEAENRSQLMALLQEGLHAGASIKSVANLFGICSRTLKRWGVAIDAHGFSVDCRKGSSRHVGHRFTAEERRRVLDTVNDPRFADLTPAQIVAILAEERVYVGSESTFYRIMREEGLLMHRGRTRQPREPIVHPDSLLQATLARADVHGTLYQFELRRPSSAGRLNRILTYHTHNTR
jgi:transposase